MLNSLGRPASETACSGGRQGRQERQEGSGQAGCLGSSERESLKVAVVGGVRSSKESSTR